MKNLIFYFTLFLFTTAAIAQEEDTVKIGHKIIQLTDQWDTQSKSLRTYEGLSGFCLEKEYRESFTQLLHDIHHYDSILYKRLVHVARYSDEKAIHKALEDVAEFEQEYSMKQFINFLHDECNGRSDIERHSDDLKSEIGSESYSGKILILETELNNYIKHITKRVDHIRKHVHHLHIQ